jgi:hypothetical protein
MNTEFITKPAVSAFGRMMDNKHTSIAGIVYLAANSAPWMIIGLTKIWAPDHVQQMKDSLTLIGGWISHLAVGYGLLMSGSLLPPKKEP